MKKRLLALCLIGALLISGVTSTVICEAHGNGTGKSPTLEETDKANYLCIPRSITIGLGEQVSNIASCDFFYYNLGANSSKKGDVAKVEGNNLIGTNLGTCTITLRDFSDSPVLEGNETKNTFRVQVKKAPKSIKFAKKSITISKGKSVKVPNVVFNKGEYSYNKFYDIVSGEDKLKIKQDKNGNSYIVGTKKGTAILKVVTYNDKVATLTVKVK